MRNNYDNETLNSIESKKMVQLEILEETSPEVTTSPGRSREVIQQVAVDEWPVSFLGSAIAIANSPVSEFLLRMLWSGKAS